MHCELCQLNCEIINEDPTQLIRVDQWLSQYSEIIYTCSVVHRYSMITWTMHQFSWTGVVQLSPSLWFKLGVHHWQLCYVTQLRSSGWTVYQALCDATASQSVIETYSTHDQWLISQETYIDWSKGLYPLRFCFWCYGRVIYSSKPHAQYFENTKHQLSFLKHIKSFKIVQLGVLNRKCRMWDILYLCSNWDILIAIRRVYLMKLKIFCHI